MHEGSDARNARRRSHRLDQTPQLSSLTPTSLKPSLLPQLRDLAQIIGRREAQRGPSIAGGAFDGDEVAGLEAFQLGRRGQHDAAAELVGPAVDRNIAQLPLP